MVDADEIFLGDLIWYFSWLGDPVELLGRAGLEAVLGLLGAFAPLCGYATWPSRYVGVLFLLPNHYWIFFGCA